MWKGFGPIYVLIVNSMSLSPRPSQRGSGNVRHYDGRLLIACSESSVAVFDYRVCVCV